MDRSKEYRRALLVKRLEKARMAEDMQFNPKVDLDIIAAHRERRPATCNVMKSPIPLYRCYFIEDHTVATWMTHILEREYASILHIAKAPAFHPSVELFILSDNKVVLEKKIDAYILAHLLFRFHHRIAKKYISDELLMIGG